MEGGAGMTAQTLAKLALGDAQTQALIGRDIRSTAISAGALAVIAEYEARRWRAISEYDGDDWVHVLYDGKVYIARRDTWGGRTFWKAPSLWVLPTNIEPTHGYSDSSVTVR